MDSDPGGLQALLPQLTRAERAGDLERARTLRREILRRRAAVRVQAGGAASERDFLLLDRIARDLQRSEDHELALEVLGAGRALAARAGDAHFSRWFSVLGARSCIHLLDLEAASQVLTEVVGRPVDERALEAVAGQGGQTLAARILTLDACGRLLSAQGRSGAAEKASSAALRLGSPGPVPGISTGDLALRHAEVLIERGDLAGFDRLRAEHPLPRAARRLRCAWAILAAHALQLRGRLSEAERELRSVAGGPQPASLAPLLSQARTLRAHTLALLNRFTEARRELAALDLGAEEVERFASLLRARESFTDGMGLMPVPMDRRRAQAESEGEGAPATPGAGPRRYESVQAEWAWRAGEVLLALHGQSGAAPALYRRLAAFAEGIDSPVLRAKHALLGAYVDHGAGRYAEAAAAARDAAERLEALDLVQDTLAAWQVARWSLLRAGVAPGERRLRQVREAYDRALGAVRDRLQGADRVVALLNRWSGVDEEISIWCRQLGARPTSGRLGWWRAWRLRRRTRATLRAILEAKRWPEADPSSAGEENAGPAGAAQEEARLREHSAGSAEAADEEARPPEQRSEGPAGAADEEARPREQRSEGPAGAAAAEARLRAGRRSAHALTELPPSLLPRDAAVAVYVSLPDRLELFVVSRAGARRVVPRVQAARGALWDLVRAAVAGLHYRDPWAAGGDRSALERVASCLGLDLLAEVLPEEVQRLYVVPDDAVVHVPFAALPVLGRPLVERWSPCFLPLAAWSSREPAPAGDGRALGVAVPRSSVVPEGDLPEAEREIEALPGAISLSGEAATREAILEALRSATTAHLACHGRFDPERPHQSALAAADGWITVEDLRRLSNPRLRLAVLGACWGARTFVLPGRALINLPLAFLDAGAGHAIASLWKVADRSSADFARELYSGDLEDPARALQRVQRAWCGHRPSGEWAPWVLYQGGVVPGPWARRFLRFKRWLQGGPRSFAS